MGAHPRSLRFSALCTSLFFIACRSDAPTPPHAMGHGAAMKPNLSQSEVARVLSALRAQTASWHNPDKAAAAGYTVAVGCSDERTEGLSASRARGMGYHTLNPSLLDGRTTLLEPELIVFGRNPANGELRFAGFDYFIPATFWPAPDSPNYPGQPPILEGLGTPLMWNEAHQGWIAHIWPWWHNPDGMFENFNPTLPICECLISPDVPLCT